MPFVDEDVHPGCKRRWDFGDDHAVYSLYDSDEARDFYTLGHGHGQGHGQRLEPAHRKILPLAKRARIVSDDNDNIHDLTTLSSISSTPASSNSSPSPTHYSHRRRRSSQLKALQAQSSVASRPPPRALLMPCHICHRRPTKKSDLDSFAECQGCGERACFVCIRQCHGWSLDDGMGLSEQEVLSRSFHMDDVDDDNNNNHSMRVLRQPQQQNCGRGAGFESQSSPAAAAPKGWDACGHRAVVCSRCCVERGVEGDVACLGCLARTGGELMT